MVFSSLVLAQGSNIIWGYVNWYYLQQLWQWKRRYHVLFCFVQRITEKQKAVFLLSTLCFRPPIILVLAILILILIIFYAFNLWQNQIYCNCCYQETSYSQFYYILLLLKFRTWKDFTQDYFATISNNMDFLLHKITWLYDSRLGNSWV